jgi:hypothetical protein
MKIVDLSHLMNVHTPGWVGYAGWITRVRTEPGNLRLRRTAWWGWEDSNFQPNDY